MLIEFLNFLVMLMARVFVRMSQYPLLSAQGLAYTYFLAVLYLRRGVVSWLWRRPVHSSLSLSTGAVLDLCRSKQELMLENALLRQQLIVLRRQVNRPQPANSDRAMMVLLASKLRTWKNALLIVQPNTLLRWHKQGFRLFWKRKSKANSREPRIPAQTVELIKQIALENQLWGAERIRGELLKLDIRVCKRTVQN